MTVGALPPAAKSYKCRRRKVEKWLSTKTWVNNTNMANIKCIRGTITTVNMMPTTATEWIIAATKGMG
jgi:hypothetical protein